MIPRCYPTTSNLLNSWSLYSQRGVGGWYILYATLPRRCGNLSASILSHPLVYPSTFCSLVLHRLKTSYCPSRVLRGNRDSHQYRLHHCVHGRRLRSAPFARRAGESRRTLTDASIPDQLSSILTAAQYSAVWENARPSTVSAQAPKDRSAYRHRKTDQHRRNHSYASARFDSGNATFLDECRLRMRRPQKRMG